MSTFGVTGFPTAFIDRKSDGPHQNQAITEVTGKLTGKSYAALAIDSSLDGDMLTIKVKLKMGYNYSALKLGLYILEDGITQDGWRGRAYREEKQRNWTFTIKVTQLITLYITMF